MSDNKKAKPDPAPKNETAAKNKTTSGEEVCKAEGGETAAATPSNYSRGEGQKPVSTAYRENWERDFLEEEREKEKAIIRATEQEKGPE
jgi:hypothetical protein